MIGTKDYDTLSDKHIAARMMEAAESQAKSLESLARSLARIADALEFLVRSERK